MGGGYFLSSWFLVLMLSLRSRPQVLVIHAVVLLVVVHSFSVGPLCRREGRSFLTEEHIDLFKPCINFRWQIKGDKRDLNGLSATRPPTDLSSSSFDQSTTSGSSAVRSIKSTDSELQLQLLSFYRFVPISNPQTIRDVLFDQLLLISGVRGTVYVASEGINAQFAVPIGDPLQLLLEAFGKQGCLPFDAFELSPPNMGDVVDSNVSTFDRLIVRTRDYILRDGITLEDGDAPLDWSDAGTELDAEVWHEQLQQSNIQLFDCRNDYESNQGTFQSAQPLNTKTFSETWSVLDDQVTSDSINANEPVYIFCTGGIRCVKVGSYLKNKLGCKDVRSLRHGIIGYERWASDVERSSLWAGDNFLFDKRRFTKEDPDHTNEERVE